MAKKPRKEYIRVPNLRQSYIYSIFGECDGTRYLYQGEHPTFEAALNAMRAKHDNRKINPVLWTCTYIDIVTNHQLVEIKK